jgi:regulator of replication initiation timing
MLRGNRRIRKIVKAHSKYLFLSRVEETGGKTTATFEAITDATIKRIIDENENLKIENESLKKDLAASKRIAALMIAINRVLNRFVPNRMKKL